MRTSAVLALLTLAGTTLPLAAQENRLALVGGMLLDGYDNVPPVHNAAILIEGDRIVEVGPAAEVQIPPGVTVIDTAGMTMLPGLIDLHAHLMILGHGDYDFWFPEYVPRLEEILPISARQLLLAGVTTAVDLGAPLEPILEVRDRINRGEIPGPRMLVSGPWVTRSLGRWQGDFQILIDTPAEAAAATRRLCEAGVDVIKAYVGLQPQHVTVDLDCFEEKAVLLLDSRHRAVPVAGLLELSELGVDVALHEVGARVASVNLDDPVERQQCLLQSVLLNEPVHGREQPLFLVSLPRESHNDGSAAVLTPLDA